MDPSFTDTEKRFVLAEMIKVSQIEVGALVEFVKSYDLEPDWLSMQVPNGRNVNQCIQAAQSMGMLHLQPPMMPPMKRKSLSDLNEPVPKRLAMTPTEPPQVHYGRNVNIQPRPPPNGYPGPPPIASPPVPAATTARRRGRPSKADKEAQAQARSTASSGLPPPLAPAPPPPTHAAPPANHPISHPPVALQEYSGSPRGGYYTAPGPVPAESRPRNTWNALSSDSSQPVSPRIPPGSVHAPARPDEPRQRASLDLASEQDDKVPAFPSLISGTPSERFGGQDSLGVYEAGQRPSATAGPSVLAPATTAAAAPALAPVHPTPGPSLEHIRKGNQTPVNTKA